MTSGWLTLQLADGQESRREVPPAPCDEVLASMAVIAAMILDGASLDAPVPPARVVAPLEAPPQGAAKAPVQSPPELREVSARPRPRTIRPEPVPPHDRPSRFRFGVVLSAVVDSAVAPDMAFGGSGGLDASVETGRLFAPSLRLEGRFAETVVRRTPYGSADFRLRAGALSACALRFPFLTAFAVRACGFAEAGELQGKGTNTMNPATKTMLWLAFGTAPRLEAALGSWAALELEGRVSALVEHDRFVFSPDVVVHDVPAVATALRLSLVLRLP